MTSDLMAYLEAAPRFWSKVDMSDACWIWTGAIATNGYGQFSFRDRLIVAHRWAYESISGPVPPGLNLDHLCSVRACVNPAHLEAVTQSENVLRALGTASQCRRGHERTAENTYVRKDGSRYCKDCKRGRDTARRTRRVRDAMEADQ